jgi:hypothetical protein
VEPKNWIEVGIFVIGWAVTIGMLKQGQTAIKEKVDEMSVKLDANSNALGSMDASIQVHAEQISTLKGVTQSHEHDNAIQFDEIHGSLNRHGAQIIKVEKWQVAANPTLKHLDPTWIPPER